MRRRRYRNIMPPGGYKYYVKEVGEWLLAGDMDRLLLETRKVLGRNKLPIPEDLAQRVEHFVCLHAPESFCVGEYEPGDHQGKSLSTSVVREKSRFHSIRLKWPKEKFLATVEEATRRATICRTCPENVKGYCTTCNGLGGFAAQIVGEERKTSVDADLGVCLACSCLLPVKVHISADALRVVRDKPGTVAYPDNCWMKGILADEN